MQFDKVLFRASSIGNLMTEPKSKADKDAGNLSEGAKTHLLDIFVQQKYGRQSDISNKYIEKGLAVEEAAITLYSRVKKMYFKKNDKQLSNYYLRGTPDLFTGLEISEAETIIDIKSSWDLYTFFRVHTKDINPLYYYQIQSYCALTGATRAKLAYCLVNTPESMLSDEKRRLYYKMGAPSEIDPLYIEACNELELSMTYDDIPMKERVIEFEVKRNDEDIQRMYQKIIKARAYMNYLEESISPLPILLAEHKKDLKAILIEQA